MSDDNPVPECDGNPEEDVDDGELIEPCDPGSYEGDSSFTDGFSWFMESLIGPVLDYAAERMQALVALIFGIDPLETDGGFVTGRPVSITDGGIAPISRFAEYAYVHAWGPDGGLLIGAMALFIALYAVRGLFDMFQYGGGRQQDKNSFIKGIVAMILWYPLFFGFVKVTHMIILTFIGGPEVAVTMFGATAMYAIMVGFIPVVGQATTIITLIPYVGVALIMLARSMVIGLILLFGPFLIAGKYSNLPVISDGADKIINKTVPIVLLPLPIGPIFYIYNNFMTAGGSGAVVGVTSVLSGVVFLLVFGIVLLVAIWFTFKLVAPQMAGSVGTIGKMGAAAATIATGGGGAAAYSAMRGGPLAAGARMLGEKAASDGGGGLNMDNFSPFNRDGSRGDDDDD